jgi:hypothetical protein
MNQEWKVITLIRSISLYKPRTEGYHAHQSISLYESRQKVIVLKDRSVYTNSVQKDITPKRSIERYKSRSTVQGINNQSNIKCRELDCPYLIVGNRPYGYCQNMPERNTYGLKGLQQKMIKSTRLKWMTQHSMGIY